MCKADKSWAASYFINTLTLAHPLTDWYAQSEQPLGVRGHDEVALASVQRRYHVVPTSLAVLNLRRSESYVGTQERPRKKGKAVLLFNVSTDKVLTKNPYFVLTMSNHCPNSIWIQTLLQ